MTRTRGPSPGWPDARLVAACLGGDDRAWSAFVDKYKNFVFSVAVRYGLDGDEASDVFQQTWLDVYNDLPKLREVEAVRGWLAKLTTHKCYHWKQKGRLRERREVEEEEAEAIRETSALPAEVLEDLERDQRVRDTLRALSERCQEMIRMLFYDDPPVPYKVVAERLGLATGSIGFIRGRCLENLQKQLAKQGIG